MTSPIAWALACPVCMSFMIRIAWPEATPRVTLAVIMLLEAVVLLGIVSGMTSNMTLKISTYVVASILYILMVSILYRGMFWTQGKQRPQEARSIFYLFTGSWLIFPIVWLLGPNMLDAISYDVVLVMFAFGDVFAKNIFTFVGFKYTQAQIDASSTMDTIDTSDTIATSDTSDTTMKKKSLGNVDPLLIAHIIEHLEEGRTMKSYGKKDEMQKHNQQSHANPWNVPQQQQQQHYQQQQQQHWPGASLPPAMSPPQMPTSAMLPPHLQLPGISPPAMPMPPLDAPHAPQPPDAMLHLLNEERAQRARLSEALLERERELAGERGKRQAAEQAVAQWQRAAQVAEHALKQESARRGAAEAELARISAELARLAATAGGQQALVAAAAAAGQERLNAQAAEMAEIVAREREIETARLAEAQEAEEEKSCRAECSSQGSCRCFLFVV